MHIPLHILCSPDRLTRKAWRAHISGIGERGEERGGRSARYKVRRRGDRDVGRGGFFHILLRTNFGRCSSHLPTLEHCIPMRTQRKAFYFDEIEGVWLSRLFPFLVTYYIIITHKHPSRGSQFALTWVLKAIWRLLHYVFAKIRCQAQFHKSQIYHFCATNKLQQNILHLSFIWNWKKWRVELTVIYLFEPNFFLACANNMQ